MRKIDTTKVLGMTFNNVTVIKVKAGKTTKDTVITGACNVCKKEKEYTYCGLVNNRGGCGCTQKLNKKGIYISKSNYGNATHIIKGRMI